MQTTWTPTELAYFAGVLDGEGCITLASVRRNNNGVPSMAAHVSIVNSDGRLIQWLMRFGGTVHPHKQQRPHHKPTWVWTLCGEGIDVLLTAVLPYLVIKREQAELLLQFRATVIPNLGGMDRPRLTPEVLEHREQLKARLQLLNRKGIAS